jgi:hypothetical protein
LAGRKGEVDLFTTERVYSDASSIQFSIRPSTGYGEHTLCCYTARQIIDGTAGVEGPGVIDRDPTPKERRRVNSRLLWIDGDTLIVQPANPLCTLGTTLAQVRALLRGRLTGWTDLVPAWPAATPATIHGYAPIMLFDDREVQFGIPAKNGSDPAYGKSLALVHERVAIAAVAADPNAVASVAWSAARDALAAGTVCAVPVDGVAPNEVTLRDGSYPAAVHATLIYRSTASRRLTSWTPRTRRWYLKYLSSARVRHVLLTATDRRRLLP